MLETVSILPPGFWATAVLLIGGAVWAKGRLRDGSGLPMLAVLGTVASWYVGDAFYNDYANNHAKLFDAGILDSAWWQVALFLLVFLATAPLAHRWINARCLRHGSGVFQMYNFGIAQPVFQNQLNLFFKGSLLLWVILVLIAALRLRNQIPYYFFPFLGYKATPWGRGQLGSGFDSLLSVGEYLQQLVAAIFGVVAALATNRRTRGFALVCCLLTWPYFIFDRTRNTMLAAVMPGVLSWGLLRVRGGVLKKTMLLGGFFVLINAWMAFVISNRSDMSIAAAVREKGFSITGEENVHHQGLNMYEELCWINTFIDRGTYRPNWGARYFGDLVNPIPRVLWPGKPKVGFDYAILRGQQSAGSGGEVTATISTGLIGQGVVNFGRLFGPSAAAMLMSFWVAFLGRLDLHVQKLGRLPLYATGLFATYNVGRDITLITLYPFLFGTILVWYFDHRHKHGRDPLTHGRRPQAVRSAALSSPFPATSATGVMLVTRPFQAGFRRKTATFTHRPKSFPFANKRTALR